MPCVAPVDCQVSMGGEAQCIQNQCVPLKDELAGCNMLTEGVADERSILLGVFYTTPSVRPTGIAAGNYIEFMTQTLASTWNNSPSQGNLNGRRMAAVLCDESKDPVRAVRHMQRLGVSAILGPLDPIGSHMAAAAALEQGTPYLTPYDQSSNLSSGARACAPIRADLAFGTASALQDIFASVSAARGRAAEVMLVSTNLPSDDELRKSLVPKISAGAPTSTVAHVSEFAFDIDLNEPLSEKGKLIARANPRPDVIVLNAEYSHYNLINQIETNWLGPTLPVYVLIGQGSAATNYEAGQRRSGGAPAKTLDDRTYVINWAPRPSAEALETRGYVDQLLESAKASPGLSLEPSDFAYFLNDCLYTATFASAAAVARGVEPKDVRSDTFNAGIDLISCRTADCPRISMGGPSLNAKSLLAMRVPFAGVGTHGTMQWNADGRRVSPTMLELRCMKNGNWVSNTRSYRAATGESIGAFECP
ncbi:MAG: hypothetical protein U0174_22325 [Polyangiaceae bacterium]